jgi:cyclophilin family peptidyl-prolyl cis-trans isomerase
LKKIVYAAALVLLAACAQNRDAANESQASSAETATNPAATTSSSMSDMKVPPPAAATATKAAEEKKPMSYENKVAEIHTTAGEIHIRFFPDVAPNHVKNFIDLASSGFYDGTKFHRVIPGFMIQGGDPNTKSGNPSTWGMGGSDKNVPAEFNTVKHKRGVVSMARGGHDVNSARSQFFIMVADYPSLDGQYSAFGQVVKGMDVADKIVSARTGQQDRPLEPTAIEKIVIRDAKDTEKGATPK